MTFLYQISKWLFKYKEEHRNSKENHKHYISRSLVSGHIKYYCQYQESIKYKSCHTIGGE